MKVTQVSYIRSRRLCDLYTRIVDVGADICPSTGHILSVRSFDNKTSSHSTFVSIHPWRHHCPLWEVIPRQVMCPATRRRQDGKTTNTRGDYRRAGPRRTLAIPDHHNQADHNMPLKKRPTLALPRATSNRGVAETATRSCRWKSTHEAATTAVDIPTSATLSAEWSHTHEDVTAHTGHTSATHAFHSGIKATQLAPEHPTRYCCPTTTSKKYSQDKKSYPYSPWSTKFKVIQCNREHYEINKCISEVTFKVQHTNVNILYFRNLIVKSIFFKWCKQE